jgi:hypothetical protein
VTAAAMTKALAMTGAVSRFLPMKLSPNEPG